MIYKIIYEGTSQEIYGDDEEQAFKTFLETLGRCPEEVVIHELGNPATAKMLKLSKADPSKMLPCGGIMGYVLKHMNEAETFEDFIVPYEVLKSMENHRFWDEIDEIMKQNRPFKDRMSQQMKRFKSELDKRNITAKIDKKVDDV